MHGLDTPPSDWVMRWAAQWAAGIQVLDFACGAGRHARWLATQGFQVLGVDRDAAALAHLPAEVTSLCADLEQGPWPLGGQTFDAVVVTHYLWRARLPELLTCVKPGGWLIYETFSVDHARYGKPSRPDFLLQNGELIKICQNGWRVRSYEDLQLEAPTRCVQRIAAQRQG